MSLAMSTAPPTGVGGEVRPRLFGTDGIRQVVGRDLTPQLLIDVALAVADRLDHHGRVLVARDFRTTSPGIARILAGTLQMAGIDVVELGEMPTPCLQFNVRALGADMGLMVTASHNPTEFNGIKFCGPVGLEIAPEEEHHIERAVRARSGRPVAWDQAGRIDADAGGRRRYLDSILAHVDAARIRAGAPKVVLDCGNGTSAVTSPELFAALGCRLTTLNANPDGHFPGHPSEPTSANLVDLTRLVVASGASLGVAFDGDSDRAAFIDETGTYLPGEVTLALFARDLLEREPGATVVTSVTSSTAVADVVRAAGGKLVVTRSGSLPVAVGIAEHHAPFGGEENGHFYWPEHQNAPDGPMSSAKLLELLARTRRPLSELVATLPRYHLVKTSVPFPDTTREPVMAQLPGELGPGARELVTLDGVKAIYADGWLLVRPSGTEPICRIFSESRDAERAATLNRTGAELVRRLVAERAA